MTDSATKRVSATDAQVRFMELLDEVERGVHVEITRDGRVVACIEATRERRDPKALKDMFKGVVQSNASDEELFSTGEKWEAS